MLYKHLVEQVSQLQASTHGPVTWENGTYIRRVGFSEAAKHVSYLTNLPLTISSPVKKTSWARGEPGVADGLGSPVKITRSSYSRKGGEGCKWI